MTHESCTLSLPQMRYRDSWQCSYVHAQSTGRQAQQPGLADAELTALTAAPSQDFARVCAMEASNHTNGHRCIREGK